MRKIFSELLYREMAYNKKVVLLTGDLGYGLWDKVRLDFPDRFYNVGSAEQLLIGKLTEACKAFFNHSQLLEQDELYISICR